MESTLSYTSYGENNYSGKFGKIILLLIIVLIVGGFTYYHGYEKHKADAVAVLNCMDNRGPELSYNKPDDLKIHLCWVEENGGKVLGIHVQAKIDGKWENITSFINREITTQYDMITFAEQDMTQYGWFSYAKESLKAIIFH